MKKSEIIASLNVFKEPRGFIRIIQAVMAIFAFSTTAGFSTVISFIIKCSTANFEAVYKFQYPFLMNEPLKIPFCNSTYYSYSISCSYSGTAEFFVGIGVIVLLYTIIICIIYTIWQESYQNISLFSLVDMGMTSLLTLLWLVASSAWTDSVVDLKYCMKPSNIYSSFCKTDCEEDKLGGFASLNVSLVLGFANVLLWLGSVWFVYKETPFHQRSQQQKETNTTAT